MSSIEADLNYDCNYNMFLTKTMLTNLKSKADRKLVLQWIRKLSSCNRTIAEMHRRNAFMYYLVLSVQSGVLKPPFDAAPPSEPLPAIEKVASVTDYQAVQSESTLAAGSHPVLEPKASEGGAFLAPSPVPKCGAFCYLAVLGKKK